MAASGTSQSSASVEGPDRRRLYSFATSPNERLRMAVFSSWRMEGKLPGLIGSIAVASARPGRAHRGLGPPAPLRSEVAGAITWWPTRKWRSGSASPCQGEGRGFESRLPLQQKSLVEAISEVSGRPLILSSSY